MGLIGIYAWPFKDYPYPFSGLLIPADVWSCFAWYLLEAPFQPYSLYLYWDSLRLVYLSHILRPTYSFYPHPNISCSFFASWLFSGDLLVIGHVSVLESFQKSRNQFNVFITNQLLKLSLNASSIPTHNNPY